ncbi:MAG: geopeptide radical SAM maturase [Alphaproteobacteria bacterium]|uniref:Geopeptide radical SAM maturase n=1 Tax=Candidatus Nitrobium versatile TaxID=2884831 RepID=A0A953M0D4_9BACT|nr:geopeptide radical SAM maturase [Candidatus Nitrobium versatile]
MLSRFCTVWEEKNKGQYLLFSTLHTSSVRVDASLLRDLREGTLSVEERDALRDEGILQGEYDEPGRMEGFFDEYNRASKRLHLTVVLNLDCNLACRYCFEGTRKGDFVMTEETARGLADFVLGRDWAGKETVHLTFYGGEPLLTAELIPYISGLLKEPLERRGKKYRFSLVTNGTLLTGKVVQRLLPHGLQGARITLDGPRQTHDSLRPYKSGTGSFDKIIANIKNVCHLTPIRISGNFTRSTYRRFPELLDYFREEGLTPDRVRSVAFSPVTGESAEFALPDFRECCDSIAEPWVIEALAYLRGEVIKRGYKAPPLGVAVCALEDEGCFTVNYDGRLYKCPALIGRDPYCVGDVKEGAKDHRESHCLDNWKNAECLRCVYLPLCFGGCRYSLLVRNGSMKGVECKKAYYDAALRDFVLQDLAQQEG